MTKRAAAFFAALVSLSSAAFSQQPSNKSRKASCIPQTRITRTSPGTSQDAPVLSGTVVEQFGAAIPNAKVLITNTRTKDIRTTSSKDDGTFQFHGLAEGNYSIKIEASNFKSHSVTAVFIEKNKLTNVDLILEVDGETTTVGVLMGEPSLIDTPPGTFIMSGDLLRRLPLD